MHLSQIALLASVVMVGSTLPVEEPFAFRNRNVDAGLESIPRPGLDPGTLETLRLLHQDTPTKPTSKTAAFRWARFDRDRSKWPGEKDTDPYFVSDPNDLQQTMAEHSTQLYYTCLETGDRTPANCYFSAVRESGWCKPMISVHPSSRDFENPNPEAAERPTYNEQRMIDHCYGTRLGAWKKEQQEKVAAEKKKIVSGRKVSN